MRAFYSTRYLQSPQQLTLQEVPRPTPEANEVLIRVRAISLNDFDWGIVSGKPWILRLFLGFTKPKVTISGCDIAGVIAEVGASAEKWQVGDRVFGDLSADHFGGFAEYVCCDADSLTAIPEKVSDEQAAGVPQAAALAWQAMTAAGPIRDGARILFNGAGGGVGCLGAQLARQYAAELTGVDSADKFDIMREYGFGRVLDYRQQDFTRMPERYDLIVDAKTTQWPWRYLRVLNPGGAYVTVGGNFARYMMLLLFAPLARLLTGKRLKLVALQANQDMAMFAGLLASGELTTPVDGPTPFASLPKRLAYFLAAQHRGKVILTVEDGES